MTEGLAGGKGRAAFGGAVTIPDADVVDEGEPPPPHGAASGSRPDDRGPKPEASTATTGYGLPVPAIQPGVAGITPAVGPTPWSSEDEDPGCRTHLASSTSSREHSPDLEVGPRTMPALPPPGITFNITGISRANSMAHSPVHHAVRRPPHARIQVIPENAVGPAIGPEA